jgi:hypothetical protein
LRATTLTHFGAALTFNKRENGRLASDVEQWINAAADVHRLPE